MARLDQTLDEVRDKAREDFALKRRFLRPE